MQLKQHTQRASAKRWAVLTLAAAVAASSAIAIANAEGSSHAVRPDKVTNCSKSAACVTGVNAGSGSGVEGEASSFYGVLGKASGSNAAVGGFNTAAATGASGVYGQSANGYGVYGFSVIGSYGLVAQGNAYVSGEIYTGGACQNGCSETRHQASFGARTSQPTIDDVGEATVRGGAAHVVLARDFVNAIDASKPYVVLLTPEGDAALYVASRNATGFDVRQVGGGHGSLAFAYRIVAKPFGVRDERLPFKSVAAPSAFNIQRPQR